MKTSFLKVLLIEDNPGDMVLIREMLNETGKVELETAETLKGGLKKLQGHKFDVTLLDLGLPDSQGIDTFLELHKQVSKVPIIILTGLSDEMVAEQAVRAGAQDYLVKGQIDHRILSKSINYAMQRNKYEKEIKASLHEKEVLLREIHHRVKNNLQIISSILNLQTNYLNDERDKELFIECQERVKSMAIIHEKLYQSEDFSQINFKEYIQSLASHIFSSYNVSPNVKLILNVKNSSFEIETTIPCGLIINELITNSIKHAFPPDTGGEIKIDLHSPDSDRYELIISDNGVGFPPEVDYKHPKTLGLEMVNSLVKQIDGTMELETNHGTTYRIRFARAEYLERV